MKYFLVCSLFISLAKQSAAQSANHTSWQMLQDSIDNEWVKRVQQVQKDHTLSPAQKNKATGSVAEAEFYNNANHGYTFPPEGDIIIDTHPFQYLKPLPIPAVTTKTSERGNRAR